MLGSKLVEDVLCKLVDRLVLWLEVVARLWRLEEVLEELLLLG